MSKGSNAGLLFKFFYDENKTPTYVLQNVVCNNVRSKNAHIVKGVDIYRIPTLAEELE